MVKMLQVSVHNCRKSLRAKRCLDPCKLQCDLGPHFTLFQSVNISADNFQPIQGKTTYFSSRDIFLNFELQWVLGSKIHVSSIV